MFEILVVDDDQRMRQLIEEILTREGYEVTATSDGREALLLLKDKEYDVVITDLKMPHVGGLDILSYIRSSRRDCPVVMITAHGTVETAIEAMKRGAYDYIQKPFDPEQLQLLAARAVERRWLLHENRRLSAEVQSFQDEFVGSSRAVAEMKSLVERVAPMDATVLIQGETGTGKELIAKLIHRKSQRASKLFLPVHCGALTETLLESELFGHEPRAFTGATGEKKGLFETANSGTIFLDEINTTSPALQVKLLRVLQENAVMRVGSARPIPIDVRVVVASNANLAEEAASGRFRKDLYYRLNVVTVNIPPLRDRRDDIPLLAYHFLNKFNKKFNKNLSAFSSGAMETLLSYAWPGNARELEHTVERAVIMETSGEITEMSLPGEMKKEPPDPFSYVGLMRLEEMETFLIRRTLRILDGQKSRAAEALGIDVTTLWRKLKKYGLE